MTSPFSAPVKKSTEKQPEGPPPPAVVRHAGCPQWGLGCLVEERDEKRIYDFEDGLSHSIAKPFWSKLEPVPLDKGEVAALETKIKGAKAKMEPAKKPRARSIAPAPMSFDEQIARFEQIFVGGFSGPTFTTEERGPVEPLDPAADLPKGKKAKIGRSQAIGLAQTLLAQSALASLVAEGKFGDIITRMRKVHQAAGNLLHPLGDVIPFSKLPEERFEAVARAAVDLLWGSGDYAPRFDKWVEVLAQDKLNTWPLATVLAALVRPEEHVFVKPSFYEKQASILGFDLAYDRLPSAAVYGRMQALGADLEARLKARGHEARDRMDVYAFLWRTIATVKKDKAAAVEEEPPYSER